jgi:hypothetical protein
LGELLVNKEPLTVIEGEVTDGLHVIRGQAGREHHVPVGVPLVQILIGIDHETMLIVPVHSFSVVGVQIKHRKRAREGGPAEGALGLGAVVEDIPLMGAARVRARLHEVDGLDQRGLPLVGERTGAGVV